MPEVMTFPVADSPKAESKHGLRRLALTALGVVYGDLGTSPLYALRECFSPDSGIAVTRMNVLGVESLVVWSLILVVGVKYLTFIVRADNQGEGGILALLALLQADPSRARPRTRALYVLLALVGTALLCGDAAITPAISVLAAVEGLGSVTSSVTQPIVMGISIVILGVVFRLQRAERGAVRAMFGPVIVVWFATIGVIGVYWITQRPEVLLALDPHWAIRFFAEHRLEGFFVLAFVFLSVTGAEALYADMGRCGKTAMRVAWLCIVLPALLASYLGQGALLLDAGAVRNPFFETVPGVWRYGLVGLATVAAIVASQAIISGCSSMAQQAVQLGYWPRVEIEYTSGKVEGQIRVPSVSAALMVGCVALVLAFQSSPRLAWAYGVAVAGTMSITSVLFYAVGRRWGWSPLRAGALVALFLVLDVSFLTSNLRKIASGGWVALAIGAVMFTLMTTWRRGRELRARALGERALETDTFMTDLDALRPLRVAGTAVFPTSVGHAVPLSLLHQFKHIKVFHEQVLLLAISTERVPELARAELVREVEDLGHGFYRVHARYGFMQIPNVLELLELCAERGLETQRADTSYFLGRQTLIVTNREGMARWRKVLFGFMSRNARPAHAFYRIPPNRVVELGAQIEI